MRAVCYSEFGSASDVLQQSEVPTPSVNAGEVLVRLTFSGVNPSDAKARSGNRPGVTKPAFPIIVPHSDGSGIIESVGEGVDTNRKGQRVWIWNGQWQRPFGTAAEYIALPADQAVALPDLVSLETGATLGIPGLTAAHCVFGGGDIAGQTVLVSGGSGAVGHNAVQLAKWGGARVIATASESGKDRTIAAGADHCLDYADPDLSTTITDLTKGAGVDRAIEVEFGRNAVLLGEVMAPGGTVAAYGSGQDMTPTLPFGNYLFKALTIDITLIYILSEQKRAVAIEQLHSALSRGALTPAIHEIMPLSDCAKAHDTVMAGKRSGAVLLKTD